MAQAAPPPEFPTKLFQHFYTWERDRVDYFVVVCLEKEQKAIKTRQGDKRKRNEPPLPLNPSKKLTDGGTFQFSKKGDETVSLFFPFGRESGVSRAIKGYIQGTRRFVQLQELKEEKDIIRDYNHLDMRGGGPAIALLI